MTKDKKKENHKQDKRPTTDKCGRCGKPLPPMEADDGICFSCAMKEWNEILK